jgi:molecular chaperone GrpE
MADDKKRGAGDGDDDAYVIEDTGESIEDIEHEMEVAAQEADDTISRRTSPLAAEAESAPPPSANEELKKAQDRYLRAVADFDNYRKRADREKAEYFKQALAGIMKELLPVLDNFDRALDHAEEGDDFHKGVLLIYKQLWSVLQKAGLEPIDEPGIHFDPNIHEAVVTDNDPAVPNHTVVAILQKGYFLHDKLVRPALVKVAVGGPERADGVQ